MGAPSPLVSHRAGTDVLRLGDGRLRAVLECGAPAERLADALAAVIALDCPVQVVVRARRSLHEGASPLARARVAHGGMVTALQGAPRPLVRRLLVIVPSDADESRAGEVVLNARVRRAVRHLDRMDLEPVRLGASRLSALGPFDGVQEHRREVLVGARWARTLLVGCHPERLDEAWLGRLDVEHDLAIHLRRITVSLAVATTYLILWAASPSALEGATRTAEEIFLPHGVAVRTPCLQAEPAFVAGLPICCDLEPAPLPVRVRTGQPSLPGGARSRSCQLLYGVDSASQQPLVFDRFSLESPNAAVLGEGGSGRSFMLRLELLRARLAGVPAQLIDVRDRCSRLGEALGAELTAPTLDSRTPFDPFSPHDHGGGLRERIHLLAALIELVAGGLPEAVLSSIVKDALAFVYAGRGYTDDGDHAERTPPGLGEVMVALQLRAVRAGGGQRAVLEAIVRGLDRYARGEGRRLLEQPAARSPERAPITVYSLGGLPEVDRPAALLLSLDHAWSRLPSSRPELVLVDGVDTLLTHEASSRFVAALMRQATARGTGLTLVAGDVEGILGGPLRDLVLRAGLKVLLRQPASAMALLAAAFRLTPAEQSWLLNAPLGEGLLLAEGRRVAFRAVASDEERRLITEGGAG